ISADFSRTPAGLAWLKTSDARPPRNRATRLRPCLRSPNGCFNPMKSKRIYDFCTCRRARLPFIIVPLGGGMRNKLFAAVRHDKLKLGMSSEYAKRMEIGALP